MYYDEIHWGKKLCPRCNDEKELKYFRLAGENYHTLCIECEKDIEIKNKE